jgi:hypothetical protein
MAKKIVEGPTGKMMTLADAAQPVEPKVPVMSSEKGEVFDASDFDEDDGDDKVTESLDTGLEEPASKTASGKTRYVRAIVPSYVNGAMLEAGQITTWPKHIKTLGPNLEEYKP